MKVLRAVLDTIVDIVMLPVAASASPRPAAEKGARKAGPGQSQPLIIGHRGASGYRPEHTLAAYELAARMGADYVEPDLVSTKDRVLVARHENEISTTTDVAVRPEFASRKTTKSIDGVSLTGWFTEDFTLAELKTLRAKERIPATRQRNTIYDGRYQVPTFQEVIDLTRRLSRELGRPIGIYPETKHPTYFRSIGLPLEEPLVGALRRNRLDGPRDLVFVQSFEIRNLKRLNREIDSPLVQLLGGPASKPYDETVSGGSRTYAELATRRGLQRVSRYADGVGPSKGYIVAPRRRRAIAASHVVRGRRTRRRPARAPLHLPQRERVPPGRVALIGRPGGLRQRVRRVRAVLRPRRRRRVLRQPRHRGGGALGPLRISGAVLGDRR